MNHRFSTPIIAVCALGMTSSQAQASPNPHTLIGPDGRPAESPRQVSPHDYAGSVARANPSAAPTAQSTLESRPMYIMSRVSVAVPAGESRDVKTAGVGFGVEMENEDNDNSVLVGMRAVYIPDPPDSPLSDSNPDVAQAWGPVFDGTVVFESDETLAFFLTGAAGFVYGVPEDTTAGETNVILPLLNAGFGGRIAKEMQTGTKLFVNYEIGLVPGAMAPYTALSLGTILAGN